MTDDVAVLDALRDAILDGEFAAGQRLVEVDLCERFGCSRFAVRAAIPVLASEGLVELQRHRGARVRVIPLAEAIEITEVRRLLEGLTAARAAERVTPAQAAQLADIIQEMRDAVAAAELLRYSDANARLHSLIRTIAAHDTATAIIERLRAQLVRHQFALSLVPGLPRCRWASTSASWRPSSRVTRPRPGRPCATTSPASSTRSVTCHPTRPAGPGPERKAPGVPPASGGEHAMTGDQQTPPPERCRDIAHVSAVELRTAVPEQTVDFFVRLLGMSEVAREGPRSYVHAWDDYERFTVCVTESATSGIGRTWLRAASPAALQRRVQAIEASGHGIGWTDGQQGIGPAYLFTDSDGHEMALYWETEWYVAPEGQRPALKNQAAPFPGRGANVRRLDHVNYLAADIPAVSRFLPDVLGAQLTEQIVLDDGVPSAVWYHVADKSYDLVYTSDWTGSAGRLHHVAFATDQREDILRAADVMLEAGIHIETGPHKHAIQQTFFLYVWEPGGNRIELCNAGARLVLAPDWRPISWSREERAKGQAWGLKTIETFHTHGTPPVDVAAGQPGIPG